MVLIPAPARVFLAPIALSLVSTLAIAAPFDVRDQNPLLAGFDLPGELPAQLPQHSQWAIAASFAWGSSAIMQANARETLLVDAETRELQIAIGRTFANGYALRLELPYRHISAGTLDSFIDGWHDFFSLPEGARPALPRDSLRIAYRRDGQALIDERASGSGIGDVALRIGKQLGSAPVTAWLGVKLPTGEAEAFTGSGSVDATVALAAEYAFAGRYSVFAQAAGTALGNGDRLRSQQKDFAWSAMSGLSARVFESFTLSAQLNAHSAVFESDEDFLGDALTLTVGGVYRMSADWDVSFAVTEDIGVESAPDVVFLFQLKHAVQ